LLYPIPYAFMKKYPLSEVLLENCRYGMIIPT